MKKLPLMMLSVSMAESLKDFDAESSIRRVLEMCCFMEKMLANILADFEMKVEKDVLEPLNKLSDEDLLEILRNKKQFAKLTTDWQNARNKCQASTGGRTQDCLKEEVEETWKKLENIKDLYSADLYHFAAKEDSYADYFITLLELQADYHKRSHEFLQQNIKELKDNHNHKGLPEMLSNRKVFGEPLLSHLSESQQEIASPIIECVHMLLKTGMIEEGLFRLAAAASVLKKLKSCLNQSTVDYEEFRTDPHAVAGALKCYLRELPEPLMTFELYNDWLKAAGYLVQFLSLLSEQQAVNKMTPSNIAIVLGPNLLWPRSEESVPGLYLPVYLYTTQVTSVSFEIPARTAPEVQTTSPTETRKRIFSTSSDTSISSISSISSTCSSSHTSLSNKSSTASQESDFSTNQGAKSTSWLGHRRTSSWDRPHLDAPDPAPASHPASTALRTQPPTPISRTFSLLLPNQTQARNPALKPGGELDPPGAEIPASPLTRVNVATPFKPKRSFAPKKPVQPGEQLVVQYTQPKVPLPYHHTPPEVARKPPAIPPQQPPASQPRAPPAVGGPHAAPSALPRKLPVKRPVLRAPKCSPPLPPLAEG
ncbi:hypothetical protein CRUP_032564 [Coryphaenoides rupestris]|nr:hypothetical protein CRUP_032564 [Coryphaenoides rupestris]